jgi:hypothetical protein
MEILEKRPTAIQMLNELACHVLVRVHIYVVNTRRGVRARYLECNTNGEQRGDVPGWVLVVLMTTGLVTAIWTIAMNGIR